MSLYNQAIPHTYTLLAHEKRLSLCRIQTFLFIPCASYVKHVAKPLSRIVALSAVIIIARWLMLSREKIDIRELSAIIHIRGIGNPQKKTGGICMKRFLLVVLGACMLLSTTTIGVASACGCNAVADCGCEMTRDCGC